MMRKFMKYEIKGTYRFILGVLALVLILSTASYGYIQRNTASSSFGGMLVSLSILILFGTALVTFFYIVGSFRKELYEDRGYLTFTLPLTGNQIVGAKLTVALMWFIGLGVSITIYYFVLILLYSNMGIMDLIYDISHIIGQKTIIKGTLFAFAMSLYSLINMLVLIYFSMALGKITLRNKKIGGLWFVIFLVLSTILTYMQYKISILLPYYIDLNTFSTGSMNTLLNQSIGEFGNGITISTNIGMLTVNIASSIFSIVSTVGLFLGTGYLIEKRIDL